MYLKNRLSVELDPKRKILDRNSNYLIKIETPKDLSVAFREYSENFYKAANSIASFLLETNESSIAQLDTYFFSLAFLYRHSLELLLKSLAFREIIDKKDRVAFAKDTFHDLEKILENLLQQGDLVRPIQEIEWLKAYFKDISKMDKESDSFRYPFHIRRDKDQLFGPEYRIERIFEEQTHIDLVKFANKFEAAYEILSLWYSQKTEMAIEWKDLSPVFIETGGTYYGQAVVGYRYSRQDFYPYVSAYIETAGFLRNAMTEAQNKGDNSVAEVYFFPMCYLYRNAIELSLKAAWFEEAREDFQKRCKVLNKKKHSIVGLWNSLRGWIEKFYGNMDDSKSYFDDIRKCCEELQGFDSDASRFRYPCDKLMNDYFQKITILDYMNIAECMESLIQAIDGIDTELNVRNEYLNEVEAEIRSEMAAEYRSEMMSEIW